MSEPVTPEPAQPAASARPAPGSAGSAGSEPAAAASVGGPPGVAAPEQSSARRGVGAASADEPVVAPARVRVTRTALLPVVILTLCVIPLAAATPWLLPLVALPLLAAGWVLRAGTDVDPGGITVHALVGGRRVRWEDVVGLHAGPGGKLRLVLTDGAQLRLPVARARHLPLIAAASGGRLGRLEPPR